MTQHIPLTEQAHQFILKHLQHGDITIDATVGNGHDMLFLASHVGKQGKVFGFDIQQQAILSTQSKIDTELSFANCTLFKVNHSNMTGYIPQYYHGKIKVIIFNCGYLPGSDKSVITQADSTLAALNAAVNLLMADGIITIMAYSGHSGGEKETEIIKKWCQHLDPTQFIVKQINSSEKTTAPILFTVLKH